jgi:hypothetical protein
MANLTSLTVSDCYKLAALPEDMERLTVSGWSVKDCPLLSEVELGKLPV